LIQRFLFELRRVIVQVMARAAVPNSPTGELQSREQLGFDFGGPVETSAAREPIASAPPISATKSAGSGGSTNHSPHVGGSSYNASINGAFSNAAVSGTPFTLAGDGTLRRSADGLPALSNGSPAVSGTPFTLAVDGTLRRSADGLPALSNGSPAVSGTPFTLAGDGTLRRSADGLPALSNGSHEPSPFAVPHTDIAPANVSPAIAVSPKSRGRAAVRARTGVLFSRLQELGLRGIDTLVLMRTRTVMVSLIGQTLRVHEGYADAPEPVLRAIVTFATARHRPTRSAARDAILAHDVERAPASRRAEPARPGDIALIASLLIAHREMNARSFGGTLSEIPIRLSGRMATRLGHFDPGSHLTPSEIVMSRRHVVRHGWKEAMHTLLHEMVHQWQHETGRPVDHLAGFRKKCREVGITPAARRDVTPLAMRRRSGAA